jgi:hypothetical protein
MAEKIKLVQGDTLPQVLVTLTDEVTGLPVDVTGAAAVMRFRAAGTTTLRDTLVGSILNGANGQVVFSWGPTTLDVDPGDYEGEVEVTFSNGARQTVYDLLKFKVREDF